MKSDILALFDVYREQINRAVNIMFRLAEITSIDTEAESYKEIEGIASILEIPTHELLMINYLYELDAYCTSIVARMNNGTVFLARNLDFYFPEMTRKLLFNAQFYMGDRLVFESLMFAGTIGIFTAYKPGAFALSINERTSKESSIDFAKNIAMLFVGYKQLSMLSREVMMECHDFRCAKEKLSGQKLIAGGYYILAGVGRDEGVIITRDRSNVLDYTEIKNESFVV